MGCDGYDVMFEDGHRISFEGSEYNVYKSENLTVFCL